MGAEEWNVLILVVALRGVEEDGVIACGVPDGQWK